MLKKILKKLQIIKSFIETKDFYSLEKLKTFQLKKLEILLLSIRDNEFYGKHLIKQLMFKNIYEHKIINKKIFMENFDDINTVNITKEEAFKIALECEKDRNFKRTFNDITIGLSSGTSGNRGIFMVSEKECNKWTGHILRRMLPKPYFQRHKIAFFLRANSNLYETMNNFLIKFNFFDLETPIEQHINNLNKFNPTLLIAPAQVLKLLSLNKNLKINPKKIISIAEVLEDEDKIIIENRFKQKVHQVYQCTEGFLAHTCECGNLHLNEDLIWFEKEWIDKTKTKFYPIITDFNRTTQPIIRYRLDDILVINYDSCPCGSVFTRIDKIEGRSDDILKMKDYNNKEYLLFPDFIRRAIISSSENVEEYNVTLDNEYTLEIFLKPLELQKEVEKSILSMCYKHQIKVPNLLFKEWFQKPLIEKRRRIIQK